LDLQHKLKIVLEKIEVAKKKSPFKQKVELIAATKTRDISQIEQCYNLGFTSIGENRVQEAEEKFVDFPGFKTLKKRFIGHLQSNKINKCLQFFDTIDSVDTFKIANKINNASQKRSQKTECLIEINTSGEPQKNGFSPIMSNELISCFSLQNLEIVGLMTIGPNTSDKKKIINAFSTLRDLKDKINQELGISTLKELSMGMTNAFELGVEEGSTMVRVGTGLFGSRKY
jgi:pyridoxal phosphate enzyme (YggS family)